MLGFTKRSRPKAVWRRIKWWETLPEGYQLWRIRQRSVSYTLAVDWRDPTGPVVDSVWPAPANGSTEWQRQEMATTSRLLVGQKFLALKERCFVVTRLS